MSFADRKNVLKKRVEMEQFSRFSLSIPLLLLKPFQYITKDGFATFVRISSERLRGYGRSIKDERKIELVLSFSTDSVNVPKVMILLLKIVYL